MNATIASIFERVRTFATWPVAVALLIVSSLCTVGFSARRAAFDRAAPGVEHVALDTRRQGYTGEEARAFVDGLGEQGRWLYATTQVTLDLLFPITYGALFSLAIARLYGPKGAWLLLLPLLTVSADLLENVSTASLAWSFPRGNPSLASLAGTFTFVKWRLVYATMLAIVVGALLHRSTYVLLAGLVVGFLFVAGIEGVSSALHPAPPGLDMNDPVALASFMKTIPTGLMLLVLLAWAVGTFAGAWVAARLARRSKLTHGLVIGVVFLLAGVANMGMIPHPVWMWVLGVAQFLPAAYLGAKLAARGPEPPVAATA
jgi:hypothetical protein